MARPSRIPRAPVRDVWLSPARNRDALIAEISDYTARGFRVHVTRAGGDSFEIIANGPAYLVRTLAGDPIATYNSVTAALAAGDQHLEWLPRVGGDEDDGDYPGSAA